MPWRPRRPCGTESRRAGSWRRCCSDRSWAFCPLRSAIFDCSQMTPRQAGNLPIQPELNTLAPSLLEKVGALGGDIGVLQHVRLQPATCAVSRRTSRRQADDAKLRDRHTRLCRTRGSNNGGLYSSRDGACVLGGDCLCIFELSASGGPEGPLQDGGIPPDQPRSAAGAS